MNTHHQVVEEHEISSHLDDDNSSELIGSVDPESFKRNYQVEQIYTVAPAQYQLIPTTTVRGENTFEGQLNLSSYSGPAYLLTTAPDGTQQLQPLQEQTSLGTDIPQIQIENVEQEEEISERPVNNCLSDEITIPVSRASGSSILKKNRPFKCDQCTASYLDAAELEEHKSKHTDDGPFTCVDCHFTFMFKSHYRSHRTRCEKKRALNENGIPSKILPCVKPYVLDSQSYKHKFPKNSIKKSCSQQEMVYVDVDSINPINRKIMSNYPKQSSSTRFNPKNPTFKRTKRTGRSDRPFECDECDATFKVDSDLKSHKMKHTGEGPFKCQECEFVFMFRKLYESHQRRCTKKRVDTSFKKPDSNENNIHQTSINELTQLQAVTSASSISNYAPIQSALPAYSQPTIIEMRAAQPSELLQVQHSVFGHHNVATTSSNHSRQDVKYELVPTVEIDGMSMNQIVNLIKVKAPSQL